MSQPAIIERYSAADYRQWEDDRELIDIDLSRLWRRLPKAAP